MDDTDGLDPETEFDEWRARELARLLRDKQAQAERDAEKEEIERRRAMPEEQRLREDMEFAEATRAREKGQMGFMQKYYHKGAFHQVRAALTSTWYHRSFTALLGSSVHGRCLSLDAADKQEGELLNRDYTAATESQVDVSMLPKLMQVRNFGKASHYSFSRILMY